MAKFSSQHQPANKGRPKGSVNLRGKLSNAVTVEAMAQLEKAVFSGEQWALIEVLKRLSPTLKAVTPSDSLDGELMKFKILELSTFNERLKLLEEQVK